MSQRALLIFIKNPVAGKVKTRVARTAGPERALAIYRELLRHTRQVALQLPAERYVYYDNHLPEDDDWPAVHFHRRVQQGVDLGERMWLAFHEALQTHERALLIGSDCPRLAPAHLEQAFDLLDRHDVVLGPALDGGYYLIGLKQPQPALFTYIEWSTPLVLQRTVERIEQEGLSHALIEPLPDVDTEEDWDRFGWPLPGEE